MIQRIQSLYLFLSLLLGLMSLFIPWVTYEQGEVAYVFEAFHFNAELINTTATSLLIILLSALVAVGLISFKNRKLQMRLIKTAMFLSMMLLLGFAFDHYQNIERLKALGEVTMSYGFPIIFPVVNLILLWLAHRGVKKDEDLIRSVDRLR